MAIQLTKSIEFDNLCKRLVIISKKAFLKPKFDNLKKIGYNILKKINEVNQIFK